MSPRFRLVTPDAQYSDGGVVEMRTAGPDVEWTIVRERAGEEVPPAVLAAADALVIWHERQITQSFIERIPSCRIIVRAGVGFDHVDLKAAGAAGIPVCNTPDYGTSEVADHAIALMLALARGITRYHDELSADPSGGWDIYRAPLVRRLRGRVFGIVGFGRIGTATALRAKAFGMRVVGYDPYVPRGQEIALGIERVESLNALLEIADVVSLHCPLTEETRNLIGAATLPLMKQDAILINTARGAVVDVEAVVDALRRGAIAGAGLDVLPVEPPRPEDPIARAYAAARGDPALDGRLLLTPHAAWSSPESIADARRLAVETAMLYLREGRLRNCVNELVLDRSRLR